MLREENLRLQRRLLRETERREQLSRQLSESESSLEMDEERQFNERARYAGSPVSYSPSPTRRFLLYRRNLCPVMMTTAIFFRGRRKAAVNGAQDNGPVLIANCEFSFRTQKLTHVLLVCACRNYSICSAPSAKILKIHTLREICETQTLNCAIHTSPTV